MTFSKVAAGLSLALVLAVPAVSTAQGKQDFTLINNTGYQINEVYVSPATSKDWEEDVLGRDTLANREKVDIHFTRAEKTCKWDLKVVYDDGEEAEWDAFDLCTVSSIAIKYDRKSGETSAEYE